MAEMLNFLKETIILFEKHEIDYVIVGGLAAILNGSARTTSDIDIIISPILSSGARYKSEKYTQEFLSIFKDSKFDLMEDQLRYALNEGYNASIFGKETVLRLDFKVANKIDELEVLETKVVKQIQNIKVNLASIEQILYGKILYLGDISDLIDGELPEYNDVKDFINVYNHAIKNKNIDTEWLKQKVAQKGLEITLNRILNLANKFA